ncbi:MAG: UbiA family prenyltransferase [Chloroflexota bacterium]
MQRVFTPHSLLPTPHIPPMLPSLIRFLHLALFGFSGMLPLLGAATVAPQLGWSRIWPLLLLALGFHAFAYILNDVVDLPIDRSQPSRAAYPLVAGRISPLFAILIAGLMVPLTAVYIHLHTHQPAAVGWLLLAFLCLAIYDVWGKKTAVPPLTDLIQGIGWAALLLAGASTIGQPNPLTWLTAAVVVVYILLVNGINASLRDVANDVAHMAAHGVVTTAVYLGTTPNPDGSLRIPTRLRLYALACQAVLFGLTLGLVWLWGGGWWGAGTAVLLNLLCLTLLWQMTLPHAPAPQHRPIYMIHIILMLILLLALSLPHLGNPLRLTLLLTFMLPLVLADPVLGRPKGT